MAHDRMVALALASALVAVVVGCSGPVQEPDVAASCMPMTVQVHPTPAVAGEEVTLDFAYVHATCNDTDPEAAEVDTTLTAGLRADDGSWAADIATTDVDAELNSTATTTLARDVPPGTVIVTAYGRDIGSFEVLAP